MNDRSGGGFQKVTNHIYFKKKPAQFDSYLQEVSGVPKLSKKIGGEKFKCVLKKMRASSWLQQFVNKIAPMEDPSIGNKEI